MSYTMSSTVSNTEALPLFKGPHTLAQHELIFAIFPTTLVFGSPFLLPLSTPDSVVGKLFSPRASATRVRVVVIVVVPLPCKIA